MSQQEVGYLGPEGTYSHLVAEKRFGYRCKMVALPTILDVCTFVARDPRRRGIVPIENSSGGALYETVDVLLEGKPPVRILEEVALHVNLALIGMRGEKVRYLYSHFAPLEHCVAWIERNLPDVEKHVVPSTAVAAQHAASQRYAAALGSRKLAKLYGLQVLKFPVEADIPNLTLFLVLGGRKKHLPGATRTTLAARTPNTPGALCTFLDAFRRQDVNLTRIISRPIRGCPRQYAFLVDIEGAASRPNVKRALAAARKATVDLRIVGTYPVRKPYTS
jgi:prephenate dehydratase